MKTNLSIIIILTTIMVLFVACTYKASTDTGVVVVRDITDLHFSQPKVSEITPLFEFSNDQWKGAIFRFVDITNVSYNRTYETSIKAENQWLSNEFERRKKVKSFYTEVTRIIDSSTTEKVGKDNSSVYAPITRELNNLHESTAGKRIMLIYSDLMENTEEMSFYDNNKFLLLKTNPDSVKKYLDSQLKLENLDGIKIYLVFQPLNIKEDEVYKVVSAFYKNLYESKGATVEITAGIN
jgi:hypothetical protein